MIQFSNFLLFQFFHIFYLKPEEKKQKYKNINVGIHEYSFQIFYFKTCLFRLMIARFADKNRKKNAKEEYNLQPWFLALQTKTKQILIVLNSIILDLDSNIFVFFPSNNIIIITFILSCICDFYLEILKEFICLFLKHEKLEKKYTYNISQKIMN